jgi:hypothetical protein
MTLRNITTTVTIVTGLLFLAGNGCSKKDKDAQMYAAAIKARLDLKEKELSCKVAALSRSCKDSDKPCEDEKAKALAECNKIAEEYDKQFGCADHGAVGSNCTTVTNTSTSTSTSTGSATGT